MHPLLWVILIVSLIVLPLAAVTKIIFACTVFGLDYFLASEAPKIHGRETSFNARAVRLCPSLQRRFYPSFWFSNRHAQTIFGHGLRTVPTVRFDREEVKLSDGVSAVSLDWLQPPLPASSPLVVVLPGISGGSHENYVRHLLLELYRHGWQSVVFNFRGAADSVLHTPVPYTIADTDDLRDVLRHVAATHPDAPIYAVGFSMGANVLVKYLGEEGAATPLRAAVSVSNPFNIDTVTARLSRFGTKHVYGRRMLFNLRKYVKRHREVLKRSEKVDFEVFFTKQLDVRYVEENISRQLLGFATAEEYFKHSSSDRLLPNVQIPLLCLSSLDDPLVPAGCIPIRVAEENPNVMIVTTKKGGHVGWMTDFNLLRLKKSWMDRVVVEYLAAAIKLQGISEAMTQVVVHV